MATARFANRARIFDGRGNLLLTYDKIAPYTDDEWGKEDIKKGQRIAVLATKAALVGFAICLDFCDLANNPSRSWI